MTTIHGKRMLGEEAFAEAQKRDTEPRQEDVATQKYGPRLTGVDTTKEIKVPAEDTSKGFAGVSVKSIEQLLAKQPQTLHELLQAELARPVSERRRTAFEAMAAAARAQGNAELADKIDDYVEAIESAKRDE